MNFLVDKSLFITYLQSSLIRTKSKNVCNLIQVFENENNMLLLTKSMIDRIEDEIKDIPALLYDFQSFVKSLNDSKRVLSQNIMEDNEAEEIINIYNNNFKNDKLFVFIKKDNISYDIIREQCCIWDNISKPNKDWIILYIVSTGQINVRYTDFASDKQIEAFFVNYFNLSPISKDVIILDSYCNYYGLNIFNPIRNNGYKVCVYTSSFKKKENEKVRLRKSIKDHFSKSTTVKFSSDKTLLHERSVIIDNFILEVNHDFAEIKRKNKNWKIDIINDENARIENEHKCTAYN